MESINLVADSCDPVVSVKDRSFDYLIFTFPAFNFKANFHKVLTQHGKDLIAGQTFLQNYRRNY